jgi:hypothetical protein
MQGVNDPGTYPLTSRAPASIDSPMVIDRFVVFLLGSTDGTARSARALGAKTGPKSRNPGERVLKKR